MNPEQEKILTAIFQKYASLSKPSLKKLIDACELKTLKKGDPLSTAGRNDSYEYFLMDSLACRYVFDEEGEIVVSGFYLPSSVITPHFARTVNSRSIYTLEMLSDGSFARIPVKVMDSLRYSFEDIKAFGSSVVESELAKTLNAEVSYRALTAKDRLLSFRKEYPNLENLIPHAFIASYLGITPVSLSRIRNELAKQ